MAKATKKKAALSPIEALEASRNSRVIVYFTGDRKPQPFSTLVGIDVLPAFKAVLKKIGNTKKITLALYTNGGHLDTPWPLIHLIREHAEEFEVLILEKALSAGTMIALGGDKIVMTPHSFLSPIDPATNFQDEENQKMKRFEIEDVIGYIDFVRDRIGITEQQALMEIMKDLTKEVNPTRLGSIHRTHALVRRLATKLLSLHKEPVSERQTKEIIDHLAQKLFSHSHLINRKEAKEIGFDNIIEYADKATEKAADNLMTYYSDYLKIDEEFEPLKEIGEKEVKKEIPLSLAVVHSKDLKYDFKANCVITKAPDPNGNPGIRVDMKSKWEKI
ncbi:hypothetical protein K2X96_00650 [Patescibacteria group bacterium]|nr:hypothetical protein [Patescibacteria group bacterium]